jgi:N-formylglutamate amidohydrolase
VSPVPVVAHVPHAGTWIPPEVRAGILLDDAQLAHELLVMTDHHTDVLFGWLVGLGATALVNRWSRLVVDPERFEEAAAEPMERVGQGAVYHRTSDGRPLRELDEGRRGWLIDEVYRPWHRQLARLVDEALGSFGDCLVLDCHSFATHPLPSEADRSPGRPDVCVGTDAFHTPRGLAEALEAALRSEGLSVRRDSPFDGALVPADRYRRDRRVRAVMLEVRRGIYCDETTGELLAGWQDVAARLERACRSAGMVPPRAEPGSVARRGLRPDTAPHG